MTTKENRCQIPIKFTAGRNGKTDRPDDDPVFSFLNNVETIDGNQGFNPYA